MMDLGIPCKRNTVSRNTLATVAVVNGCLRGMKWANLENLSTTTRIVFADPDWGIPAIKSIVIISNDADGTCIGCNRPE